MAFSLEEYCSRQKKKEADDSEEESTQALLQQLMANKLGFTTWNMDEYILGQIYF